MEVAESPNRNTRRIPVDNPAECGNSAAGSWQGRQVSKTSSRFTTWWPVFECDLTTLEGQYRPCKYGPMDRLSRKSIKNGKKWNKLTIKWTSTWSMRVPKRPKRSHEDGYARCVHSLSRLLQCCNESYREEGPPSRTSSSPSSPSSSSSSSSCCCSQRLGGGWGGGRREEDAWVTR